MTRITTAGLKAVEGAAQAEKGTIVVPTPKDDPAPNPVALAEERAQQLTQNITTQGLDELRKMRDQIDELMHGIKASHEALVESTNAHARKVASCIEAKVIIGDALEALKKDFSKNPVISQES